MSDPNSIDAMVCGLALIVLSTAIVFVSIAVSKSALAIVTPPPAEKSVVCTLARVPNALGGIELVPNALVSIDPCPAPAPLEYPATGNKSCKISAIP